MDTLTDDLDDYYVDDSDEEPVLCWQDGRQVDTWREGYPYPERMWRDEYEVLKRNLQIELLKLQNWMKESSERLIIVFEGRDAAGKGGTIKRFMEHLNPRGARVVALERRASARRPSGTSSATSSTFPQRARSCCSTGPGTTAPVSRT